MQQQVVHSRAVYCHALCVRSADKAKQKRGGLQAQRLQKHVKRSKPSITRHELCCEQNTHARKQGRAPTSKLMCLSACGERIT
jgi:hypothetical protein